MIGREFSGPEATIVSIAVPSAPRERIACSAAAASSYSRAPGRHASSSASKPSSVSAAAARMTASSSSLLRARSSSSTASSSTGSPLPSAGRTRRQCATGNWSSPTTPTRPSRGTPRPAMTSASGASSSPG